MDFYTGGTNKIRVLSTKKIGTPPWTKQDGDILRLCSDKGGAPIGISKILWWRSWLLFIGRHPLASNQSSKSAPCSVQGRGDSNCMRPRLLLTHSITLLLFLPYPDTATHLSCDAILHAYQRYTITAVAPEKAMRAVNSALKRGGGAGRSTVGTGWVVRCLLYLQGKLVLVTKLFLVYPWALLGKKYPWVGTVRAAP